MHSTKPSHQAHNNFNLPNHPIQYIGITSLALLSLITLALVFPFVSNNSSALSPAELQTNMPTSGSIALALPGEATMDVVPTASGSFSSATAKLSVSSTNPTGYSLYINTNDNTNALANVDSTKTTTIPAVSGAQLGSQLDANTWGYNLSPTSSDALSLNYQAVPLKSSAPGTWVNMYQFIQPVEQVVFKVVASPILIHCLMVKLLIFVPKLSKMLKIGNQYSKLVSLISLLQ